MAPAALHAFTNIAAKSSKMLILTLPGGAHEGFFLVAVQVLAAAPS